MMTQRQYAQHRATRGLPGGSLRAVQVAIESGRLSSSLAPDGKRIANAEQADAEWEATTQSDKVPTTGPTAPSNGHVHVNPLADARTRREVANAELREMEIAERRGELVLAKDVEAKLVQVFSACKTKLLGIAARCRQQDPSLSSQQIAMIDRLVREALEDLAGE